MQETNEIILYQPDQSISLEVRLEDETVWLTQAQMVELFQTSKQNISLHINNVFKENELDEQATVKYSLTVQREGTRTIKRKIAYYSLDVIISVGYRVKSRRGVEFRQWANKVLKDYLLRGYAINRRLEKLEKTVADHSEKIDFFVRTSLPPVEGIFYDGQIFDAYAFIRLHVEPARTAGKDKKGINFEVTICDLKMLTLYINNKNRPCYRHSSFNRRYSSSGASR